MHTMIKTMPNIFEFVKSLLIQSMNACAFILLNNDYFEHFFIITCSITVKYALTET